MNNKIEELRKEQQALNDKINALEQELKQTEPQGKWKPEQGEVYCCASPTHHYFRAFSTWLGDEPDNHRYNAGFICQTEEEAAEVGKRMYYRQWFRDLSDVTEHMWMESSINKFYAYYDWDVEQVCYDSRIMYMCEATYFTSEEKLEYAIETIGRENFEKYVMRIKGD